MKVATIRVVQYTQATIVHPLRHQTNSFTSVGYARSTIQASSGSYVEVILTHLPKGRCYRTKSFLTLQAVQSYLNWLNARGYLSDQAYDDAWEATLQLEESGSFLK